MKLVRWDSAQAFLDHAGGYLLEKEAEHNLLFGVAHNIIDQPGRYDHPPYFAAVQHTGQIVAAALRTPPFRLLLSYVSPEHHAEVVALLADDMLAEYGSLPGVLGLKDVTAVFARHWRRLARQDYRLFRAERIYKLESVLPVSGVSGLFRRAVESDRPLVAKWIHIFSVEALEEDDRDRAARTADSFLAAAPDRRGIYLWEDGGSVVSMAGHAGVTPNGARVGPVYTPPEHRGKGYASACTAALSRHLLERGRRFCFLFTDLANPTSNHIYQQIGYTPVCDVDEYIFHQVEAASLA